MRAALERADQLKRELEAHERSSADACVDEGKVKDVLAQALRMLHPDWTPERAEQEAEARIRAEVAEPTPGRER